LYGGTDPYKKSSRCSGRRKKTRGRPKLRWEDGVVEDTRKLGERNWRNAARNRDSWQKLLKKALAQKGADVPMMMTMMMMMMILRIVLTLIYNGNLDYFIVILFKM